MTEIDMEVGPMWTTNALADIVRLIKIGYCVVLCTSNSTQQLIHHIYHQCKDEVKDLHSIKIVHIDLSDHSDLLGEGEWPYYIEEAGCTECTCNVRKYSIQPTLDTQLLNVKLGKD